MDKCLHQGNRSGDFEEVKCVSVQGLARPVYRRIEKCMDCYEIVREPVTREEWLVVLRPVIGNEIAREILVRKENRKASCNSGIEYCGCDINRAFDEAVSVAMGQL